MEMADPELIDPIYAIKRLAVGILEVALIDLSGKSDYFKQNALSWVKSDRSSEDYGSFLWCCSICGLDSDAVRPRLISGNFDRVQRSIRVRNYSKEDYNARRRIKRPDRRFAANRMRATH